MLRTRPLAASRALLGALLIATTFWVFDLGSLHGGIPSPLDDTWEYGVAARHLLAGDGYRTGVIHPPLWTLRDSAITVPLLIHGPLAPAIVAPLVLARGAKAIAAAAVERGLHELGAGTGPVDVLGLPDRAPPLT